MSLYFTQVYILMHFSKHILFFFQSIIYPYIRPIPYSVLQSGNSITLSNGTTVKSQLLTNGSLSSLEVYFSMQCNCFWHFSNAFISNLTFDTSLFTSLEPDNLSKTEHSGGELKKAKNKK